MTSLGASGTRRRQDPRPDDAHEYSPFRVSYPVEIVIPSAERKKRMLAHGARLVFPDGVLGYDEAPRQVHRRYKANPDRYFLSDQYGNEDNWRAL